MDIFIQRTKAKEEINLTPYGAFFNASAIITQILSKNSTGHPRARNSHGFS
jgi:hypothetical protein